MNKEKASKLWKLIQETGDFLKDKLPDHPNHPKGRNPYAHVAICVKKKFNASYKDIEDEKLDEVIEFIEFLKRISVSNNVVITNGYIQNYILDRLKVSVNAVFKNKVLIMDKINIFELQNLIKNSKIFLMYYL